MIRRPSLSLTTQGTLYFENIWYVCVAGMTERTVVAMGLIIEDLAEAASVVLHTAVGTGADPIYGSISHRHPNTRVASTL